MTHKIWSLAPLNGVGDQPKRILPVYNKNNTSWARGIEPCKAKIR
jgi:hypothetical protein